MRRLFKSKKPKSTPPQDPGQTSTTAHPPPPSNGLGLQLLAVGEGSIVDIVAVHGLNGTSHSTWTAENGKLWLRDWLPSKVPNARIFSWGYDANTHSTTRVSCAYLYGHAKTLVSDLCLEREVTDTTRRPIIFVAHSLGGIIVKSALIHSDSAREGALESQRSIKLSTYGIIFMGTPHQGGSGVALGKLLVNVASVFINADNRLLQHLERDSEWLQQQLGQYGPISKDFVTKFAFEEYPTPTTLGHKLLVVPQASAVVPGASDAESILIHADHVNMVRFESPDETGYQTISKHLFLMARSATTKVNQHWETEARVKAVYSNQTLPVASYVIPFPRNRDFVGRQDQLAILRQRFFEQRDTERFAITGLGGVGKTQVALQFVYWVKERWSDYSILWLSALSAESFVQSCDDVLRRLGIVKAADDEDPKECLRRYLSSERAGKWLVVVDNADDMDILDKLFSPYGTISMYFPALDDGLVLFTTRYREAALSLAGRRNILELHSMTADESIELLETSLDRLDSPGDTNAIRMELSEELAYHPLAITQAAAYLNVTRTPIKKYLQLLHGTKADTASLMSREFGDNTRYTKIGNAVATTWLISFEQIRKSTPTGIALLDFISQIEHRAIPQALLPNLQPEGQDVIALSTLQSYCFVTRRGDAEVYDMHRLVHLATKIWIENDGRESAISEQATRHVAKIFPSHYFEDCKTYSTAPEFLPHGLRLLRHGANEEIEERYTLCMKIGEYLDVSGWLKEGHHWAKHACDWGEKHLHRKSFTLRLWRCWLAQFCVKHGLLDEAIKLIGIVLKSQTNMMNAVEQDRFAGLDNLTSTVAMAALAAGLTPVAIELLESLVKTNQGNEVGKDHFRLELQHSLASAYLKNDQSVKAVGLLEAVVHQYAKMFKETDSRRLESEGALAQAYRRSGEVSKAVKMSEHVAKISRAVHPEKHHFRRAAEEELAAAYELNGQTSRAVTMLEEVFKLEKERYPEEHPQRLELEWKLVLSLIHDGQISRATDLLNNNLRIRKKSFSEETPELGQLSWEYTYSRAYIDCGHTVQAIRLLEHLAKHLKMLQNTIVDPDHAIARAVLWDLARAYFNNEQPLQAIKTLEKLLEVQETLPEDDPHRLEHMDQLALAYVEAKQVSKGIHLQSRYVRAKEKLPKDDPKRLKSRHQLADLYLRAGQASRSIEILNCITKIQQQSAIEDDARRSSQRLLGQALLVSKQLPSAIEVLERLVHAEGALPSQHPDRLASGNLLGSAYLEANQPSNAIKVLEGLLVPHPTSKKGDPSELAPRITLGRAYLKNGQLRSAIEALEYAVDEFETTTSEDDHGRLEAQEYLAQAYQKAGKLSDAIELLEHVVRVRENHSSDDDEVDTALLVSQHQLGVTYLEDKQFPRALELFEYLAGVYSRTRGRNDSDYLNMEQLIRQCEVKVDPRVLEVVLDRNTSKLVI